MSTIGRHRLNVVSHQEGAAGGTIGLEHGTVRRLLEEGADVLCRALFLDQPVVTAPGPEPTTQAAKISRWLKVPDRQRRQRRGR